MQHNIGKLNKLNINTDCHVRMFVSMFCAVMIGKPSDIFIILLRRYLHDYGGVITMVWYQYGININM